MNIILKNKSEYYFLVSQGIVHTFKKVTINIWNEKGSLSSYVSCPPYKSISMRTIQWNLHLP